MLGGDLGCDGCVRVEDKVEEGWHWKISLAELLHARGVTFMDFNYHG